MVRVTVETEGISKSYECELAVLGMVSDVGTCKNLTVSITGDSTAYAASMLGCQMVAKLIEPFDSLDQICSVDKREQ